MAALGHHPAERGQDRGDARQAPEQVGVRPCAPEDASLVDRQDLGHRRPDERGQQAGAFHVVVLGRDPPCRRELLGRLRLEPVFTAHPTEATRRTLLRKEQRIARRLVATGGGKMMRGERIDEADNGRYLLPPLVPAVRAKATGRPGQISSTAPSRRRSKPSGSRMPAWRKISRLPLFDPRSRSAGSQP